LYEASRAQHTEETIVPALKAGKVVVCERYTMSTMAYQGYGRRIPLPLIKKLNEVATGGLEPDLTLVIAGGDFAERDPKRKLDRLERESADFHRRVREGYRALARGKNAKLVDARGSVEEVHQAIVRLVEKAL